MQRQVLIDARDKQTSVVDQIARGAVFALRRSLAFFPATTFAAAALINIPSTVDVITTVGYASITDGGGARYIYNPDVDAAFVALWPDWSFINASNGKGYVLDGSIAVNFEMFGAVGDFDPVTYTGTDDYWAIRALGDFITWNGGGNVSLQNKIYRYGDHSAGSTWRWNEGTATYTIVRRDGKTVVGAFHGAANQYRPAHLINVDGLHYDGNGAQIWSDGDFSLTAADYGAVATTSPLVNAQSPFQMWKCHHVVIENLYLDGGWSRSSTNHGPTNGGSRISHAMRTVGCQDITVRNVYFRDWSMDAIVATHRYKSTLESPHAPFTSIALGNVEAYPEPAITSDPLVYYPEGAARRFSLEGCVFEQCGRVALAPVGVWGWREKDCTYLNVFKNESPYPVFQTGDPSDGVDLYQIPGVNPGYAVDFEPDRNSADQVLDIYIENPNISGCKAAWGVAGDWMLTRVQNTISGVDTANDILSTATTCTLPRAIAGQKPNAVRFFNTAGDLPLGLLPFTDYWISKVSLTEFKVHTNPEDAIAGTNPVDIQDAGTGTTYAALHKSQACIDKFIVSGGYFENDVDDENLIITGNCPITDIGGMHMVFRHPQTQLAMLGLAKGGRLHIHDNRIDSTRSLISEPTSKWLKTAALPGAINVGTNVITIVNFSPDSDIDAPGRYANDIVYFAASGGDYPLPLAPGKPFWVTRTGVDTFQVSASEEDAFNGVFVDITTAGTGTLTVYRDYEHSTHFNFNNFNVLARPLYFLAAAIDTGTETIYCRGHGLVTGESLNWFTTGTLPTGIAATTTNIYAIRIDADHLQVAANLTDANNGVPINLTTQGTGRHHLVWSNLQTGDAPISMTAYAPVFIQGNIFNFPQSVHPQSGDRQMGYVRQAHFMNNTFRSSLKNGPTWSISTLNNNRVGGINDDTTNRTLRLTNSLAGCVCIGENLFRLTTSSLAAGSLGGAGVFTAGTSQVVTITAGGVSVLRSVDKLEKVIYPSKIPDGLIIQREEIVLSGGVPAVQITAYNTTGGALSMPTGVYQFEFDRSAAHP